jgi:ADP-heptose:LPS heptosyltransferase
MDGLIARLMIHTGLKVVLTGADMDKLLEQGWENEPRVIRRAGVWSIREAMAVLPHAELIFGSETGLMNAAGFLPVPKVVTLSHSSVENLTKHWANTVSLTPRNTPCYPCHMMHYNWDSCHKGPKEGVSLCQENIDLEDAWEAVQKSLNRAQAA